METPAQLSAETQAEIIRLPYLETYKIVTEFARWAGLSIQGWRLPGVGSFELEIRPEGGRGAEDVYKKALCWILVSSGMRSLAELRIANDVNGPGSGA